MPRFDARPDAPDALDWLGAVVTALIGAFALYLAFLSLRSWIGHALAPFDALQELVTIPIGVGAMLIARDMVRPRGAEPLRTRAGAALVAGTGLLYLASGVGGWAASVPTHAWAQAVLFGLAGLYLGFDIHRARSAG